VKGLRAYGEMKKEKRAANITAEDVFNGMAAMLSVFIREPQFQGQTKDRLTSADAQRLTEQALRDPFDHWLAGDPANADNLLAFCIERAEERLRRRAEKDTPRKTATRKLRLPGKLTDCARESARARDLPGRGRQRRRLRQAGA
jgi:topoisomerase-4 subunit B